MDTWKIALDMIGGANMGKYLYDSATAGSLLGDNMEQIAMQLYLNQQNALWNKENITDPAFQMEAEEWDRRAAAQQELWKEQFNMQNAYNDPSALIKRMRAAGLNPAMLQGETGAIPAANGDVPSPAVNEAASIGADSPDIAKIKTANSQADLQHQQAIETAINNITAPLLNWGKIKIQNADINVKQTQAEWNEADKERAKQLMKTLAGQAEVYQQTILESRKKIQLIEKQINEYEERIKTAQLQNEINRFERDIQYNAMHTQDENGSYYYDPSGSFMANIWKETKKWALQEYIDNHNMKPHEIKLLKAQAAQAKSLTDLYNWQIPILKIQKNLYQTDYYKKDLEWKLYRNTYNARQENILGTLSFQNGMLKMKSSTMPLDYWTGWGAHKIDQALQMGSHLNDFIYLWGDKTVQRAGNITGVIGNLIQGQNFNKQEPSFRNGNDIWDTGLNGIGMPEYHISY